MSRGEQKVQRPFSWFQLGGKAHRFQLDIFLERVINMKLKKYLCAFCVISLMAILLTVPAFAAGGDVAGAVEQTWDDAATQIKTVVDNVVFPALSMILAIAFFVKLGMSYFDYRTRGQFEWTGPAILFVCLIFVLLAPNYIWGIIGI